MTLVELAIVLAILTVALGMFAQTLATSAHVDPQARETALAAERARMQVEAMRSLPFEELFARFNADPADDPEGPGTAPGQHFDVPGFAPWGVEGRVGTIEFPVAGSALREDVVDPLLGMPRDLDGDGLVDALDHAADHAVLPVRVRLEWTSTGSKGKRRTFSLHTMFANL